MGILLVVSLVYPPFVDRYLLPYVIGLALLLGAVIDLCWSRELSVATTSTALLVLVSYGRTRGPPRAVGAMWRQRSLRCPGPGTG
ncbi:hypothetical protein [Streptomyces sp. NBC_00690]|uniref:hypothetical protein n=1 Tax=Streptomyces sp. NBC_00690 TaxID=2975808 RepID=UPI002E2A193E|nr:hypothetical protein [Streptomyces sp. NBC_00690]